MNREGWRDDALCAHVDPEIFFPSLGETTHEAKRICAICPVKKECLDFAMERETDVSTMSGVYGGLSPRERIALRRAS